MKKFINVCNPDAPEQTWDYLESIANRIPDYDNSGPFDIHLFNNEKCVEDAVCYICNEIGYNNPRALIHMTMVLLNLYRTNLLDPERWIGYSRDTSKYKLFFKYNRLRITYRPLLKVMDGLEDQGYVDEHPGSYNRVTRTGKCTRVRSTSKLIRLLVGNFRWTPEVFKAHEDEEVILLKDDLKKLIEYDDDRNTRHMRCFLNSYNDFIADSYIDLHYEGYRPEHTLHIDLSRKRVRRIFNNGSLKLGGRFYGGWWIGIPSELRLRIIINNQKVAECDYSNMSIHLLYMQEGIDYSRYGKDGYTLPDYGDDKKTRDMFKLLLLAMLSSGSQKSARAALQNDINFNRSDYPDDIPDLKQVVEDFTEYHKPIEKHFYTKVGLEVMYKDSVIAESIMRRMMVHGIPVLPVHDSFICPKKHTDLLQEVMLEAYRLHVPQQYKSQLPRIRITYDENSVDGTDDGTYCYDMLSFTNKSLMERMILHDQTGGLPVMYQIKLVGSSR